MGANKGGRVEVGGRWEREERRVGGGYRRRKKDSEYIPQISSTFLIFPNKKTESVGLDMSNLKLLFLLPGTVFIGSSCPFHGIPVLPGAHHSTLTLTVQYSPFMTFAYPATNV